MNITIPERVLIEGCLSGKRDTQYQLYQMYSKAMYNICRRMINDPDEAQDVLQNSFIDVFTKLQMFRYESTIGAWIKRIVINNCINHIRKNKNEYISLDSTQINESYEEPNDVELNISEVNSAILDLPEGYKVIFSLYAVEGYDHGEISEILGISESTSKSQYHRAKAKLYEILKSNGAINRIYQ